MNITPPQASKRAPATPAPERPRAAALLPLLLLSIHPQLARAQEVVAQQAGAQEAGAPEVRVRVEITGVDRALKKNIEALTGIAATAKSGRRSEAHILRLYERAPEEIAQALEPFGYYRPTVNGELDTSGSTWIARYNVDPGPPLLIGSVDLEIRGDGEQDSAFIALVGDFPLVAGDTLRHSDYEAAKSSIARLAAERGYLDAAYDSSVVLVDLEAYTSEVVLHFSTGPRFYLGEVTFAQEVVNEDVLLPYVEFEPGEFYSARKLRALQSGLSGSNYFSSVEVIPRRDLAGEDRVVPIEIVASARKTQRYKIGVGASTDTGLRIRLTGEWRRLNRHGHYASGDVRLAERDRHR